MKKTIIFALLAFAIASYISYKSQPIDIHQNFDSNSTIKSNQLIDKQPEAESSNNSSQSKNQGVTTYSSEPEASSSYYTEDDEKESDDSLNHNTNNTDDRDSEPEFDWESIQDTDRVIVHNNGIKVIGQQKVKLNIKDPANNSDTKTVQLLDVEISNDVQKEMEKKIAVLKDESIQPNSDSSTISSNTEELSLPSSIADFSKDLGMSNVPVLDQGQHGTCGIFSTTAAVDAKKNSGDYISQQCLLELGVDQQSKRKGDSGWNGAWPNDVLKRIQSFGIVDKPSCPHIYGNNKYSMTEDVYVNYSNKLWSTDIKYKMLKKDDLEQLKQAINNGHRLIISTLLHNKQVSGFPINGKNTGLWKLPEADKLDEFKNDIFVKRNRGSHAVVVTGYDDAKKLIKIRNSWGKYIGDNGDYYMTYDFYNLMNTQTVEVM